MKEKQIVKGIKLESKVISAKKVVFENCTKKTRAAEIENLEGFARDMEKRKVHARTVIKDPVNLEGKKKKKKGTKIENPILYALN